MTSPAMSSYSVLPSSKPSTFFSNLAADAVFFFIVLSSYSAVEALPFNTVTWLLRAPILTRKLLFSDYVASTFLIEALICVFLPACFSASLRLSPSSAAVSYASLRFLLTKKDSGRKGLVVVIGDRCLVFYVHQGVAIWHHQEITTRLTKSR